MTENEIFEEVESIDEFDAMDDLAPKFLRPPKVGEKIEIVIKGFKKVTDKSELEFSFEKGGKQKTASNALSSVDYGIKITTMDGATFWISSWKVWGQIKAIAKKLGSNNLNDVELQINHIHNGMEEQYRDIAWGVKTKIDGEWKSLNSTTNEWE